MPKKLSSCHNATLFSSLWSFLLHQSHEWNWSLNEERKSEPSKPVTLLVTDTRQSHFILNFPGTSSCFDVHLPGCSHSLENSFEEWNLSPAKWFPALTGLFQTVGAAHNPCLLIPSPVPRRPAALSVPIKSVPWFLLITENQNTPVSGRRMGRGVLRWVQQWVRKSASRPYRQVWLVLPGTLRRGELCVRHGTVNFRGKLLPIFTKTLTSR